MSRCVVAWPYLDLTVWHSRIYVRRTLIRTGSDETASRRLTARGARGGGRGGLPAVRVRPPPRIRAQAVLRSLLPEAGCPSKVQLVKAQGGSRREHEVMASMDETRSLEGGERIDGIHPAAYLRDQLFDRPDAL